MSEDKEIILSLNEKITFLWNVLNTFTHLTIELSYIYLSLTTTASRSNSYLGHIYRIYGRLDKRWAIKDPNIISIKLVTVLIGLLGLFQIYGISIRAPWRHPLQIIICTAEIYGSIMIFTPEWLNGSPNLIGNSFEIYWMYFILTLPIVLLWDSFSRLSHVSESYSNINTVTISTAPSSKVFILLAGLIVVYLVVVPLTLLTTQVVPISV